MMKTKSKLLLCLLSCGCLVNCSLVNKNVALNEDFLAKQKIVEATKADLIKATRPDQYYEIARQYQKNGNTNEAVIAYQKSLQLDPGYTKSITGLAAAYADQKLYSMSIPLFEQVTKLEPVAVNFNNLGYAYYLNKQYVEAKKWLTQAIILEPNYAQAKSNLALAEVNMHADKDLNPLANKQDNTDYVMANSDTTLIQEIKPTTISENIQAQLEANNINSTDLPTTNLQQISKSIYELSYDSNLNSATVTAKTTQTILDKNVNFNKQKQLVAAISGGITFKHAPVISKLFDLSTTEIVAMQLSEQRPYMQVINGNGLKGIARAVAGQLKDRGVENIKVADAKRFNLSRTHIQYRTGYRESAMTLNEHLINHPVLVINDQMPSNVSVRLVLGRDLMKNINKVEMAIINNDNDSNYVAALTARLNQHIQVNSLVSVRRSRYNQYLT